MGDSLESPHLMQATWRPHKHISAAASLHPPTFRACHTATAPNSAPQPTVLALHPTPQRADRSNREQCGQGVGKGTGTRVSKTLECRLPVGALVGTPFRIRVC